jgi:hypothetical protein
MLQAKNREMQKYQDFTGMSLYRAQGKMRFYLDKLQENYGRT